MTLSSWLDIVNMAILKVGGATLTTWPIVTPASREEKLVKQYWTIMMEEVARDHEWMDLFKQAQVEITESDPTEYQYQTGEWKADLTFEKAAGLVKIRDIYPAQPWRVEGGNLYLQGQNGILNETSGLLEIWIRGTYVPTSYTEITDALLIESMVFRLAQKICYGLNAQAGLEGALLQQYMMKLGEARDRDKKDQRDYQREDYKEPVEIWGNV